MQSAEHFCVFEARNEGDTLDVLVLEDNQQFLSAFLYGGQSYRIDYYKDGEVSFTDSIEITPDAGYHLYTDPIDSYEGGISGDGTLLVEKYIAPEPVLICEVPEEEGWISVYNLKSRQIHTSDIDIPSMVDEVVRRINEEGHPQLFISSSAFRNEITPFEVAHAFSGKRSQNVKMRMEKILSEKGYKNKMDYTFLPFEIKVVTDPDDDSIEKANLMESWEDAWQPDYVKILITSSPQ
jgi:hypothetical protein